MEKILELLDTMKEGLDFIQIRLSELKYEEALIVMKDLLDALDSVYNSIQPMRNELPENSFDAFTAVVKYNINKVIDIYKQGKEVYAEEQIEKEIIPSFLEWKNEIERVLKPYLLS